MDIVIRQWNFVNNNKKDDNLKNDPEPTAAKKAHLATPVNDVTTNKDAAEVMDFSQVTDQSAHQLGIPHHSWGADDSSSGEVDNSTANVLTVYF